MGKVTVTLTVNGQVHRLETQPNKTMLCLLRENLGLTAAKDACGGEGECGACTVLMDGKPVNSCLVLAGQADGCEIKTVEGLVKDGRLHPLQRAFIEAGAVQCGFCTPGALLSALYLLELHPEPSEEQIRGALVGNLCRCTGYAKMITAVQKAAKEMHP